MKKEEVRDFLIKLFPGFSEVWNNSDTLFKEKDGTYTYHGLFSEFSNFFRTNIKNFADKQLSDLFSNLEEWIKPDEASMEEYRLETVDDEHLLANAACTCFLEYIAGEGFTERIKPFMGRKSLEYYSHYDH